MIKTKLLTRRQVMEIWAEQSDELLDTYTCPKCRDLLYKKNNVYFCNNIECSGYKIELTKE